MESGFWALLAFVLGWLIAQGAKLVGDLVRKKRLLGFAEIFDAMTRSGGMPSGHAASFGALVTYLGLMEGFLSNIFALALCTAIIIVYDAVNVRYAVGKHGELLNTMSEEDKRPERKMRVVAGHTVPQVAVGAGLGILIGILVAMIC